MGTFAARDPGRLIAGREAAAVGPVARRDGSGGTGARTAADDVWMRRALDEARRAGESGEVPVGALVVRDGALLAAAGNAPLTTNDPTGHAEIRALRRAGEAAGAYRLPGAVLYVTLEPCLMCFGAALHARVDRIVFGASDPKVGAADVFAELIASGRRVNHRPEVCGGLLADESAALLRSFFRQRR